MNASESNTLQYIIGDTSLTGRWGHHFENISFKYISVIDNYNINADNALSCVQMGSYYWWVDTGLDNGLVPPGNKPLPDPMFTQSYKIIWYTRPQWVNGPVTSQYPAII